jgi:hypothetical protein
VCADGAVGAPFVFGSREKSKIKAASECRRERYKKMSRERERERGCCGEKERQADWIYEHGVRIAVAAAYPMGVTQSENKPSLHKGKTRGQNTHTQAHSALSPWLRREERKIKRKSRVPPP